ncbi:odorant receptor 83a-like [Anastrepha obliqua]|uniref:odorant receptor 83a-like n=1 Tax=Anastrepha obliqua TaxID=95512 RepID=UPI0024093209|nr:odorant receptor 83a-like [Anastrepha obliqua]
MESSPVKTSPLKQYPPHSNHQGHPLNVQRRDMFRFIRWNFWFTAMYRLPLERYFPTWLRHVAIILDWAYELFLYFTLLHIDILFMFTIYLNQEKGDLELIVSCMIQTVIYTWALVIKVFFKRIQSKRLQNLMEYLNNESQMHSAAGFTYVTMDDTAALSNTWITVFLICCYAGVTFWLVVPILNRDHSLPLACWYPIDYKVPYIYEIVYLLQIIGQLQIAGAFGCTSAFYLLVSVLISGQFDILNCSLKNILATTYLYLGKSKAKLIELREAQQIANCELNQYYSAKEYITDLDCLPHLMDVRTMKPKNFHAAFKMAFVPCIMHHRYILVGLHELEKLYSFVWFLKTLEVTLLICLVAFAWVKRSPWYLHSREIKNDALFFILNAQRPFRLTGGKMYNLNVEKFRSILTTSFSILTILQKMDQREAQSK